MSQPLNAAEPWDVIVIGAGAAGFLAAARSAERGLRTLLLEKNRKPGVKILISGGTRCNLTHDCDRRGIIAAFGSAGEFLHAPLAALGPRELVRLFNDEGLPTKVEPATGKIFPLSDRAFDVVTTLLRMLTRCGAELATAEPVTNIEKGAGGRLRVTTSRRKLDCARLIVTTGGKSYPGCGTTGDGYRWLAAQGHTIRPPRPALVPLTSDDAWVRELAGITLPDVLAQIIARSGDGPSASARRRFGLPPGVLIQRRGSLLFTHFGVSGPVALDVSRAVTGSADPSSLLLVVDLLPDVPEETLSQQLRAAATEHGKKQMLGLVPSGIQHRLAESILALAKVPLDRRGAELTKTEQSQLVKLLKQLPIHVTGSRGFDKAEVTAGGVALDEVDSRTMQSKLAPGLFLAGEILDLDGFIGGYNFQAAFSTGWLAGSSV